MKQQLDEHYAKVIQLIIDNSEVFTDYERKCLLNYAIKGHTPGKMIPDLVREVYDKLNILEDEQNIYLGFIDILEKEFNYKERNIVEVGGGIFPSLANRIAREQTIGKIKVYDPRLSKYENNKEKLTLVREKFYSDTPLGNANLLILALLKICAFKLNLKMND